MDKFEIKADFSNYKKAFLEENSKHNLISKNDEKFLFEKHIYDSLSLKLFLEKYNLKKAHLLDIGCGGGFPCVPLAIEFSGLKIVGIDSIRKKINSINAIKAVLGLENLTTICDRVENIKGKSFDIITSRAVADLGKICDYALPLLKKDGYFVAYKSKKALEELENAKSVLEKFNAEVKDIINIRFHLKKFTKETLLLLDLRINSK